MASTTPIPTPLTLLLLLTLLTTVLSHAIMTIPNQRGTLRGNDNNPQAPVIDPDAETDYRAHFPAGDKSGTLGAGKASQERAAGSTGWTPFEPLNPNFKWRADVCGDAFGNPEHMKGGKYYNDGKIVASYKQGGKVSIAITSVAHHNGFIEFHVCDVKKCDGGEISQKCFRDGHCVQLTRSKNPICDSGLSKGCAPIDPNYPGRWYFPCSKCGLNECKETYGGDLNTILYDLPPNLTCEHCVLQWYWSTANGCNPPGVIDFFDSENAPKNWGNCPGSGEAVGGVSRVQRPCGKGDDGQMRFPEEYLQCADISITSNGQTAVVPDAEEEQTSTEEVTSSEDESSGYEEESSGDDEESSGDDEESSGDEDSYESSDSESPVPEPVSAEDVGTGDRDGEAPSGSGAFSKLVLWADGKAIGTISNGDSFDVSGYGGFTVEAVTSKPVSLVQFSINGDVVKNEYQAPYILSGNNGDTLKDWSNPILNQEFTLRVEADGSVYEVSMTFTK